MLASLRVRTAQCYDALFVGDGDRTASQHEPLMDLIERDSEEGTSFLKTVMFFGGLGGILLSLCCSIFLGLHWDRAAYCNRPLRWWLLVHCALQLVQAPVRLVFFAQMQASVNDRGDIRACVRGFTQSAAWQISRKVSTLSSGWFVLGIVWVLNSAYCKECPGLYWLCTTVIMATVSRILITVISYYYTFPSRRSQEKKPVGATEEVINKLEMVKYTPELFDDPGTTCAICLSEFSEGDVLRKLPCNHCQFHSDCIDKWLLRIKKCPLCMGDVDKCSSSHCKHD